MKLEEFQTSWAELKGRPNAPKSKTSRGWPLRERFLIGAEIWGRGWRRRFKLVESGEWLEPFQ